MTILYLTAIALAAAGIGAIVHHIWIAFDRKRETRKAERIGERIGMTRVGPFKTPDELIASLRTPDTETDERIGGTRMQTTSGGVEGHAASNIGGVKNEEGWCPPEPCALDTSMRDARLPAAGIESGPLTQFDQFDTDAEARIRRATVPVNLSREGDKVPAIRRKSELRKVRG